MDKAPDAFRTISEVADSLDVPQHVLRFWETRFAQIKPMKRSGGRRYYRREDVQLLRGIRHLLYGEGYTIRGVQRILREQGVKAVQGWDAVGTIETEQSAAHFQETGFDEAHSAPGERPFERDHIDRDEPEASPAVASSSDETVLRLTREELTLTSAPRATTVSTPEVIIVNRISDENIGLLRGAMNELLECRKLLDRAVGAR